MADYSDSTPRRVLNHSCQPAALVPLMLNALDHALAMEQERRDLPRGDIALSAWDEEAETAWSRLATLARRLWQQPAGTPSVVFVAFVLDLALGLRDPEDARRLLAMISAARPILVGPSLTRRDAEIHLCLRRILDRLPLILPPNVPGLALAAV